MTEAVLDVQRVIADGKFKPYTNQGAHKCRSLGRKDLRSKSGSAVHESHFPYCRGPMSRAVTKLKLRFRLRL